MPKVSVILSSYNHEKYIAASIESVLNQSFTDFELLIFDDGSTDNSQKIIRSFKDNRIKLFLREKNIGAVQCYLECCRNSAGKYIALQHSDDIWEHTKLEKQVQFLEENSQYEVCFTQAKFIDERGELYDLPENHSYKKVFKQKNRSREEWLNYLFWQENCFCNPTTLMRNSEKNFVMAPSLFQLPDYFMWVHLCLRKTPYVLPEELIYFRLRRGEQNSVSSWSPQKLVRVNNEQYFIAKSFLPLLSNTKFFLKVFPEAEIFRVNGKINLRFAFARLCLRKKIPAFQKFALEILYDLLHNETTRNELKLLYDYDEKNFISDTGNFDVFGINFQLKILNSKLYLNFGEDFSESNTVKNSTLIRLDEKFTATFDFYADKKIWQLRFDPDEDSALAMKISKILVNGEVVENFISNAFQIEDEYFYFVTADPFFIIEKEIPAGNVHVEIWGEVRNDALQKFEIKYAENFAQIRKLENSLQEKISCAQQLEISLHQKVSHIQHLENSLQEKFSYAQQLESSLKQLENFIVQKDSQIQHLEDSLQEKISTIQQLENSLQQKDSQIQHLENSLQGRISTIQQLESSLQQKDSHIQHLENSLQEKISTIQQLENKISTQNQELNAKIQQINSQTVEITNLKNLNAEILNSNSWKVTKPLRYVGKIFRKL